MTLSLRIEREAEDDIAAATQWYSLRSQDLAERFIADLNECMVFLVRDGLSPALIGKYHRQFPLATFPFNVVYTVIGDLVLVEPVYHMKRDPKRKLRRKGRKP